MDRPRLYGLFFSTLLYSLLHGLILLCFQLGSMDRSALNFPQIVLPEDLCMSIALLLRDRCNQAFGLFRQVASGNDLKKFLSVLLFTYLTLTYFIFLKISLSLCTAIS